MLLRSHLLIGHTKGLFIFVSPDLLAILHPLDTSDLFQLTILSQFFPQFSGLPLGSLMSLHWATKAGG